MTTPSTPPPSLDSESRAPSADLFAHRLGIGVVLLAAALFFVAARSSSMSEAPDPLRAIEIPHVVEPIGDVDLPPTRFHWTPGGDDVDLSQVIVYRKDSARIWESSPTESTEVIAPDFIYEGIRPGEPCYWRVREVTDGKARAASGMTRFVFRRDSLGNEAPATLLNKPMPKGTPLPKPSPFETSPAPPST